VLVTEWVEGLEFEDVKRHVLRELDCAQMGTDQLEIVSAQGR